MDAMLREMQELGASMVELLMEAGLTSEEIEEVLADE